MTTPDLPWNVVYASNWYRITDELELTEWETQLIGPYGAAATVAAIRELAKTWKGDFAPKVRDVRKAIETMKQQQTPKAAGCPNCRGGTVSVGILYSDEGGRRTLVDVCGFTGWCPAPASVVSSGYCKLATPGRVCCSSGVECTCAAGEQAFQLNHTRQPYRDPQGRGRLRERALAAVQERLLWERQQTGQKPPTLTVPDVANAVSRKMITKLFE